MGANKDIELKSASRSNHIGEVPSQRANNICAFSAKYDAMLYMIEVMASLQQMIARTPNQSKEIEELKCRVTNARKELKVYS
jgi:hypothetical protein